MIDWDAYRSGYDGMTHAEQVAFYDRVWELHPVQRHFDAEACAWFLSATHPLVVAEAGGWRGELASDMLGRFAFIRSWRNTEICRGAVANPVCFDPRYSTGELDPQADVLILSHVIEHMRLSEVEAIVEIVQPHAAFVQSPLSEEGQDWAGYQGSHVLREGWRGVIAMLAEHDLTHDPSLDAPDVRCFR